MLQVTDTGIMYGMATWRACLGLLLSFRWYQIVLYIQCVSKNIPDIFGYNSKKHCLIFIIFGTRITKKVGNQQMI